MATKKNPQDSTRKVQGKRDRGQDAKEKDLERRVKTLEAQMKRVLESLSHTNGVYLKDE